MGIPFILHIHGRDVQEFNNFSLNEKTTIKQIFNEADGIICNSVKTRNLLLNIIGKHRNVVIIPFGVEQNSSKVSKSNTLKIISVCNLVAVKSIDTVLRALGLLKNRYRFEYHIIGDGPEFKKLVDLSNELHLNEIVKFHGRLDNEDILRTLPSFDIFVLPSINEAFGIAYLEALAAGLPCIAVEGQGCLDIDPNSQAILYTKPSDEVDLSAKIEELIVNNDKRGEMSANAKQIVLEKYNWEKIVEEYCSFYKRTIERNPTD